MWKAVKGFEQFYKVSDLGEVFSLRQNKIMKPTPNSTGYLRVRLKNENHERTTAFVHRLVAEAFCDHPEGCDVVNHLDFNYLNNTAQNLEWTTAKGNAEYSAKAGRMKIKPERLQKIIESQKRKKVIGRSIENGQTITFSGVNETKKYGFEPSCVSNCCTGKRATHAGYEWSFAP